MTDLTSPSQPSLLNWAEVFALGIIWGASFLSVRIALDGMHPLWIATGRIGIAALTLVLLSLAMGLRLPPLAERKVWLHALGFAVFSNALPFTLIAWAQTHVQSSFVGISMALVPLFTLLLAHVLLPGERLTLPRAAGVALGLVGVVVLIGVGALDLGTDPLDMVARLACIGVTLSYAIGSIIARRSPRVDPIAFSTAALILAGVIMIPLTFAVEGGLPPRPPLRSLLALVYLGLMPTALATLIMVHVIRSAGPTFLTQTNYQVPVWSVLFGVMILSEPLPPQFLAALGLILTGLAVSRVTWRWRRAPL